MKNFRYWHLILVLFLHGTPGLPQTIINIDHRQMTIDSSGFIGDLEIDFDLNNSASTQEEERNFIGLKAISDMSLYTPLHHYFFKGHWAFFELEEEEVQNQSFIYFRTNFLFERNIAPEIYAQVQFDELRRLNFRGLAGGGLRFVILEKDDLEIEGGTGLMYEIENWEFEEQNRDIEIRLLKSSSYFGVHKSFGEHGISVHNLFQWAHDPDIDEVRTRFSSDIRFDTAITRHISFVVHTSLSYDAKPIIPNKKFLYAISNALRFSFATGRTGEHH